ncbi:EF-hand calcium-binding domain-containing protein 9 [Balamuthia mandrillaris]
MKVNLELLGEILCKTSEGGSFPSSKTPFEVLYTEEGFENARTWFRGKCHAEEEDHGARIAMNENQFINFLRKLTDFNDYEILEILDIFDKHQNGSIAFEEFFLILSMLSAREFGQATQFLYLHGRQVFEILCHSITTRINFERFARLGFVMGIPEEYILMRLLDYNLNTFHTFDREEFILYYFDILTHLDDFRKKTNRREGEDGADSKGGKCLLC